MGVALDGFEKSRPPLGFDPWTVQPVASCNTDYAIPETAEVFDVKERGTNNYHWSLNG
jgi:hypothetical protein